MAKPPKAVVRRPAVRGNFLKGINAHLSKLKTFPPKLPVTTKSRKFP